MEVVTPYNPCGDPPPLLGASPPPGTNPQTQDYPLEEDAHPRANRSSSSPSTMEEDGEEERLAESSYLLEQDSEGSGRATPESGHPGDERQEADDDGRRANCLNNERTQKPDAKELGTPLIEQLVSRSGRSEQVHNHNHNHNMKQAAEQTERPDDELLDNGGSPTNVEDLASQLFQLQAMVKDMRDGLTVAMEALTTVQADRVLEEKVDANKAAHEQQLADVVQMVLALKSEFAGMVSQLATANETQQQMRGQVDLLQYERDILLEELETHGVVSEKVRQKYHSGRKRPNGLTRANDSTLSVLLERARSAFNTTNGNSDQDSGVNTYHQGDNSTCGEVTPPNVSPMVQSYIAGLPHDNHVEGEEHYESDSSLTAAANKSLDMSRSLGDKCAELTNVDSSDEEDVTEGRREAKKKAELRKTSPTSSSGGFKRPASPKRTPPHEKSAIELARSRVGREILETERKYCSCLWTILDHFANPLKEAAILPNKEISVMFPECLTRIYEHHCAFLQKLEERMANWKWHGVIGDVFSAFIDSSDYDVLVQYRAYVNEFPAALNQLKKSCRHSLRFRKFLRKCQMDPVCEGLDLGAFLLTPVQRIPRYVLLLKQMLKFTLSEHIDYYYIEACLAKLGTFLTQLNDSIEYSMKMVANDTTPKPKRKIRMGSLRSSGSSFDGMQLSSATRDSGVQSAGDNTSILSTSSNGRMFQLSVVKDAYTDRPLGVPDPGTEMRPPSGNNSYDSRTMPAMGTRRQRERLRRPKSSDVRLRGSVAASDDGDGNRNDSTIGGGGDDDDSALFAVPKQLPPRPRSMAEAEPGAGFITDGRLQLSSASLKNGANHVAASGITLTRHRPLVQQLPYNQSQADPYSQSSTLKSAVSTGSVKSLPDGESHPNYPLPSHSTPSVINPALGKSLNHLPPHGYGIYGSELGEEGEEGYSPISPTEVGGSTRRAVKLAHRSRSQGHLVLAQPGQQYGEEEGYGGGSPGGGTGTNTGSAVPGSSTPSQYNINAALARSLSPPPPTASQYHQEQRRPGLHRPKSCVLPAGDVSLSTPTAADPDLPGAGSLMSAMRPRASSHSVVPVSTPGAMPGGPDRPPRENVWDESTGDASLLSVSDLTGSRRKEAKKKKKERQKRLEESLVSESGRKKTGIKDSLKNIFFKKRKNDKEKIALQDVLATDAEVMATSIKLPLQSKDSALNIRPSSAKSPQRNQCNLVVKNGEITLERPGHKAPSASPEEGGGEPDGPRPQSRLKKRPHSVCYGAVTCTPQEKKSSLKSGPSRSSLGSSKVVEIGPGPDYGDASSSDLDQGPPVNVPRQTAPPLDESLIITGRTGQPPQDLATYEDENGDPCSAV